MIHLRVTQPKSVWFEHQPAFTHFPGHSPAETPAAQAASGKSITGMTAGAEWALTVQVFSSHLSNA